ncbi:alpha/beta hydrolase [Faecalibacterium duncaniae]|jgi:acetyl esterase/lipase
MGKCNQGGAGGKERNMKQAKRIVAMVLCLLALLALPAGAVMEKGEPNITAQTTMKEVRSNPGIKNSGFYTYSQDKDCPPGQALWEMTTVEGYTNEYVAEGCAKGLNLVIENYNNGVQVTHSFYTDAEKAADRTKNNTGLFYFPAKAENAKFALILAGSGANESAELEEGACTAWQLHELGYAAFILRYRVWTDASDDAPLEDIGRAMQYIEEHAAEFGIQPEQYAIVGYSMGGHLTGLFGTESVGYKHYNVPKPAALLLGYPINDMTYIKPIYHVIQDIGAYGPKYYTRNLSDEITPDYPATYHWHGVNDTLLKELVYWRQGPQLEAALQANHVKHVYRVFNNAPHVCGIGTGTDAENWLVEATAFWEEQCA